MQLLAAPILDVYRPDPRPRATFAIIVVGTDAATETFIAIKQRQGKKYGVNTRIIRFPATVEDDELCFTIAHHNRDNALNGLIVQLPLPRHLNTDAILTMVAPDKDVDSLAPESAFVSPMVQAVQALVTHYKIDLKGKRLCLVGYGRLVGKPLSVWLKNQGFQPDIIDHATRNAERRIQDADIIFAGTGKRHRINAENTREGQIIFDCSGMDVDYEAVKNRALAITPPKGSIGPLTVHFLLLNVLKAAEDNR